MKKTKNKTEKLSISLPDHLQDILQADKLNHDKQNKELKDKNKDFSAQSSSNSQKMLEAGSELRKALQSWDTLTKTCIGPSADEQMLEDVQKLLRELKDRLKDFED